MSISKTVKHAIRSIPNVEKVTFKTRKVVGGEAEFCTVKIVRIGVQLPNPLDGRRWEAVYNDNFRLAAYRNEQIRQEVISAIRAIVKKAYGWSAQTTSGGTQEWTIRLNSEF